jgi:hypothetical protein
MLRRIAALAFVTLFTTAQDAAAFSVFHSPANDGTDAGVALIPDDGSDFTLNLWFDPEVPGASPIFGYSGVFLTAAAGLGMFSFTGESDVLSNSSGFPTTLGVDGGDINMGDSEPRRIGTLVVRGSAFGGTLSVSAGMFTDNGFNAQPVSPLPQLVAQVVPEPGAALLLGLGISLTAGLRWRSLIR